MFSKIPQFSVHCRTKASNRFFFSIRGFGNLSLSTFTRVFIPVFFMLHVPAHLRPKALSKEHTQRGPSILPCYLSNVPHRVDKPSGTCLMFSHPD